MEDFKRKTNNIFIIKETLKNQLNILGAEITNITTFRAYADWLDTWTDNLYKKIRDITVLSHNGLYGKTSQNASPTPEYPSEVKTFSGEQTVTIEATNIFNFDYFTDTSSGLTTIINGNNLKVTGTATSTQKYVTNYIQKPFERGKYVFSISKELPLRFILRFYNNGSTMFSFDIMPGQTSTVIDLDEPVEQYRLILNPAVDTTYNIDVDVKLEKGEEIENKSFPVSLKSKNLFDNTTSAFSNPNRVNITTTTDTITITTVEETTSNNLFFRTKIPDGYLENGKTYTLSSENVSGAAINLKIQLRNKDGSNANKSMGYSIVYDSNYSLFIVGNIFSGNASDVIPSGTTAIIKNVQVEKGSEATDFEPFYDIELCKIGDYQDSIKKSTGNQLFDGEIELGNIIPSNGSLVASSSRTRSKNFIKVKPNTTYTFTRTIGGYRWVVGYTSSKVGITDGNFDSQASALLKINPGTNSKTFTTSATTEYIKWYDTESTDLTEQVMVNEGSTALPYEPYNSAGKWLLHKEIGKVVLDGSEGGWNTAKRVDNTTIFFTKTYNELLTNNASVSNELSNYFKVGNPYTSYENTIWLYKNGNNNILRIGFSTQDITTTAQFTTWLSTHNTIVYYVLATPTTTEITREKYPTLYKQLDDINDYLIKRFIKKEFLAELDKPVIKENS